MLAASTHFRKMEESVQRRQSMHDITPPDSGRELCRKTDLGFFGLILAISFVAVTRVTSDTPRRALQPDPGTIRPIGAGERDWRRGAPVHSGTHRFQESANERWRRYTAVHRLLLPRRAFHRRLQRFAITSGKSGR